MLNEVFARSNCSSFPTFTPPDRKKRVGNYVLGQVLGEGKFGQVRIGIHIGARQKVAVKVIAKGGATKRDFIRKVARREAMTLQRLRHPNIVPLYDVMETETKYYMVLELVHGGTLRAYLDSRRRIEEAECRSYMTQLVSAVDHMHQSMIVHRDLKLDNSVIDSRANVKIVDMGMSTYYRHSHSLSTQCGSPAYAAPEVLAGRKYGPEIDIWSLGVSMFALLSGEFPFCAENAPNIPALYAAILKGCIMPSYVSQDCRNLLLGMLQRDETKRMRMTDLIEHPWFTCPDTKRSLVLRYPPISRQQTTPLCQDTIKKVAILYQTNDVSVVQAIRKGVGNPMYACYNLIMDGKLEASKSEKILNIKEFAHGCLVSNDERCDVGVKYGHDCCESRVNTERDESHEHINGSRRTTDTNTHQSTQINLSQTLALPFQQAQFKWNGYRFAENVGSACKLPDIKSPIEGSISYQIRGQRISPDSDEKLACYDTKRLRQNRNSPCSDTSIVANFGLESEIKETLILTPLLSCRDEGNVSNSVRQFEENHPEKFVSPNRIIFGNKISIGELIQKVDPNRNRKSRRKRSSDKCGCNKIRDRVAETIVSGNMGGGYSGITKVEIRVKPMSLSRSIESRSNEETIINNNNNPFVLEAP